MKYGPISPKNRCSRIRQHPASPAGILRFRPHLNSGFALALALASAVAARADGPYVSPDTPAADAASQPHYPIPYQRPVVEQITAVMRRVLAHADDPAELRVVDRKTKREIVDFSAPNPEATATVGGYPIGVLHAGALLAGQVTGDRAFTDFTARRLQFIGDRLPYFEVQARQFGLKNSGLRNFLQPDSLDACGAWGAALVKARLAGVGPDLRPVIERWADYVSHGQFRLPDGTLARNRPQPDSLWGDDMYMSIPFLAQMGRLTGEPRYYDDAVRQVRQFAARLFVPSKGIFAHGWTAGNPDYNPAFFWGRANGWCLMAMVELLSVLPEDHPGRAEVLTLVREQIQAIAQLQSGQGLWHQLLDKPDSYLETSCSAMFVYGIARSVNRGWVSAASYGPVAQAGWNAVARRVAADGAVEGVCPGTSLASDAVYYYNRPSRDDVHGYGPVLLAGSEMIRLLRNDRIGIQYGTGGVYIFTDRKR